MKNTIGRLDHGKDLLAAAIARLHAANVETERDHPLPRCEHGSALRDGAGEALEPPCGCRAS